jgi:hypothetical protein
VKQKTRREHLKILRRLVSGFIWLGRADCLVWGTVAHPSAVLAAMIPGTRAYPNFTNLVRSNAEKCVRFCRSRRFFPGQSKAGFMNQDCTFKPWSRPCRRRLHGLVLATSHQAEESAGPRPGYRRRDGEQVTRLIANEKPSRCVSKPRNARSQGCTPSPKNSLK